MDKLKMHTPNRADENFRKLAELFPNAVTETINENGELVRAIDKDVLMQEISTSVVEGKDERYQFTWPDKKKAVLLANSPIAMTLRPCREESVDFDNTENLYIEGDNLDVLKLLQETYLGKVKMIYIDPPYNTGNDFVYNDDFSESADEYLEKSGQFDEDGNRLFQNTESNGRFHTDWLNMIYPRLKLAKDLLADDGVIFISIDDNEVENLKKVCNEIFGEHNFVSNMIWQSRTSISNDHEVSLNHNHTLIYSKQRDQLAFGGDPISIDDYINPDNDPRGPWKLVPIDANHIGGDTVYAITNPKTGKDYYPPNGRIWCYNKQTLLKLMDEGRIKFGLNDDSAPKRKLYYYERIEKGDKKTPSSIILNAGTTKDGTEIIMKLFDSKKLFDYPKSVELLSKLVSYSTFDRNGIILDFFSGSATTAHAVMQLNAEDGGHRKFIMVQLPEQTDEKSEAYKAGYKNICEIGKERIRRAGTKLKNSLKENGGEIRHLAREIPKAKQIEIVPGVSTKLIPPRWSAADETVENRKMADDLDVGFRVLKLDSTNMKDVYYHPDEIEQSTFDSLIDNVKDDRTPEDLLFQVMLDLGVLLSSKIEVTEIAGKTVYNVADNYLIACFDDDVSEDVVTAAAKLKPYYFVMRDSSMADDNVATNFDQIFEQYSKETVRRVI